MTSASRTRALQSVFEDWVASRPGQGPRAGNGALSPASAQLYRDMWAVFTQFLLSHPLPRTRGAQAPDPSGLARLRAADLAAFLASAQQVAPSPDGWSSRYAWRMLHLIDRVLRFHALHAGTRDGPNTAAADLLRESPFRFANASQLDREPLVLDRDDVLRLRRHLERSVATATAHPLAGQRWREARDAAIVALMLGSGLAPGDVQALHLLHLGDRAAGLRQGRPAWHVQVPADGLSPEHAAPVADWAVPVVEHWLQMRGQRGIASHWAFPSTLKGAPLTRMSLHRRVVRLMLDAGVEGGVPFRLRHTFAVMRLTAGHDAATVGQWLGLVESKAMQRYVDLAQRGRGDLNTV